MTEVLSQYELRRRRSLLRNGMLIAIEVGVPIIYIWGTGTIKEDNWWVVPFWLACIGVATVFKKWFNVEAPEWWEELVKWRSPCIVMWLMKQLPAFEDKNVGPNSRYEPVHRGLLELRDHWPALQELDRNTLSTLRTFAKRMPVYKNSAAPTLELAYLLAERYGR